MAAKDIIYNNISYKISYDMLNTEHEPYILVLHGWGAKKELMMAAFKNKFKNFRQVYVDMPGFGNSSVEIPIKTSDYAGI
ncbi:MAG: alpha/beta hydrolase, partial [Campylobacter sp.]|nr:alpha/beta hydrolase [Campylobacter sp.]